MPKLDRDVMRPVQDALGSYEEEVEATECTRSTKNTYLLHARQFVRWLNDDFEPGVTLRDGRRGRRGG